jgi:deoxyribodipyrimidine photo-lyase
MLDSVLVWFRRDLRDHDHAALGEALRRAQQVFCAFVFDREILDALPSGSDRRVAFIRESLVELDAALRQRGGGLIVRQAWASSEIPRLASELGVAAVFANRDYEPRAKARDAAVESALGRLGIGFESFKDQAVFDGPEVLTQAGSPYTVFTPYKKAWLKRLTDDDLAPHASAGGQLVAASCVTGVPSLAEIGFAPSDLRYAGLVPGMSGARQRLDDFRARLADYKAQRDFPALNGTSALSVHLRFGTVSIRDLVSAALADDARRGLEGAESWLSELIWRDFYFMILDHFPQVVERSFRPQYDALVWEQGNHADSLFGAWCTATTGYPLVDAAMRQLNGTGFMHNRLRMVVASFLTKDLGIDWRRGEAYFAAQLNDYDLSANNGGWQWAASTGCDAQPYFRIFNPVRQSERFDPGGCFIRHYLPELAAVPDQFIHAPWRMSAAEQSACGVIVGRHTPRPLVEHDAARQRTLERYAAIRQAVAG